MTKAERWKIYYAANRDRILAARKLPAARARQREVNKHWYDNNLDRARAIKRKANRKWVDGNRAAFREGCKRYRERNPEKVAARKAAWETKNAVELREKKRRYREQNADSIREYQKKYLNENRGKFAARNSKRRAIKKGASIGTDRAAVAAFCESIKTARSARCYWCDKPVRRGHRHIDHIVPLTGGGLDSAENLCCSCAKCNRRKSNQRPEVFSGQMQLL